MVWHRKRSEKDYTQELQEASLRGSLPEFSLSYQKLGKQKNPHTEGHREEHVFRRHFQVHTQNNAAHSEMLICTKMCNTKQEQKIAQSYLYIRKRKWQPTPVFLPGESQRRRSLVGCRLWGRTESDLAAAFIHSPIQDIFTEYPPCARYSSKCQIEQRNKPLSSWSLHLEVQ